MNMRVAEYLKLITPPPKRNKYNAKKVKYDGFYFASMTECERYKNLKLMERAGRISMLEVHPKHVFDFNGKPVLIRSEAYPNGRKAKVTFDFKYIEDGQTVVEDVKGSNATITSDYKLRKAFYEAQFPHIKVREITQLCPTIRKKATR